MTRHFIALFVAMLMAVESAAQEEWLSDTEIRNRFLSRIVALREAAKEQGMSATELRRELNQEKRGLPDIELPEPVSWSGSSSALYEKTKGSTLIVGHIYLCDSCDEWHTNLAGGVVITADGIAVTNFHVLQFEKAAIFAAMDDQGALFAIDEVLASNRNDDLAVIRLRTSEPLKAAPLASAAEIGEQIVVVSHPDAHFFSFTTGAVSRFSRDPDSHARQIEISAPFARGSSGSGIFNRQGHLIGIASATNAIYYEEDDRERRNLQMVIHSGVPVASLKDLLEGN